MGVLNQVKLTEEQFISELREDLPILTGESFKRHTPAYYDEANYYNTIMMRCPKELMLTSLMGNFIYKYTEKNAELYDLVNELLDDYDRSNFDRYSD